jgi:hypothetical protein
MGGRTTIFPRIYFRNVMTPARTPEITALLKAWSKGDWATLERLTVLMQRDLRRLARL